MKFRKSIIALSALSLIAGMYGCKKESTVENIKENNNIEEKKEEVKIDNYGDALSTGEIAEPMNLIPAMASDSASHNVTQYIYNGLVKYDKDLNLVGDLAEKWEISPDHKEITFYLKKGVKWHDGEDFTADDVRFTYEFMVSDDTPTNYDGDFRFIDKVEVIDPYTIKIYYKEQLSTALSSWGIWIMPEHALKDKGKPSRSPLQRKPIGTGPYKLESWTAGQSVVLTAFHDYFEGRPNIEKIFIRVIPNQTTQFLELLNGSIDIMSLTPKQEAMDTKNGKYENNYNTYSFLDFAYTYVGYNLRKAPFNKKEFRQALTYASNRKDIVDGLLYGKGQVINSPYKIDTIWYNKNVPAYDYNIEKAKELLASIGFKDEDNDGFLEYNGKPFKIEIMTNQGNDLRGKICEILQNNWSSIGIKTEIKQLEWATMLSEKGKGNFDAILLGWNITLDPDQYDIWHSSKCKNGLNFICYKNDRVDELLTLGRAEINSDIRKKYYDELQMILAEDQPYTFLYTPYSHTALSKRFQNIHPAPAGITYNFIEWYVPKVDQKYKVLDK